MNEPSQPPPADPRPGDDARANPASGASETLRPPAPGDPAPESVAPHEIVAELDSRPEAPPLAMRPLRSPPPIPPDNGPGVLVLLWVGWLLGNLALARTGESTMPAVRWLILAAGLGATLLWPAFRLSSALAPPAPDATLDEQTRPASAVLFDWLCLMLILQIFVWPMRITQATPWSQDQTAWVLAALGSWSLLFGAVVALGARSTHGRSRTIAMAACVLLFAGEPLLMAAINLFSSPGAGWTWRMFVSPIEALWEMTERPSSWTPRLWRPRVMGVAAAAGVAWAIVGLLGALTGRRSR